MEQTDLSENLRHLQLFVEMCFGRKVDFEKQFEIPDELPWKRVVPIYDPGDLTNRMAINLAIKSQGLQVYEESEIMNFSGSEPYGYPRLMFIRNSALPDRDTLGLPLDSLRAVKAQYISARSYIIAFGLVHFIWRAKLDADTYTIFPNDAFRDTAVCRGFWSNEPLKLAFDWFSTSQPQMFLHRKNGARSYVEAVLKK